MRRDQIYAIADMVSNRTGVPRESIFGPRRHADIVIARHATWMLLARCFPTVTLPSMAARLGVDHSSVIHAMGNRTNRLPANFEDARKLAADLLSDAQQIAQATPAQTTAAGRVAARAEAGAGSSAVVVATLASGFDETAGLGI